MEIDLTRKRTRKPAKIFAGAFAVFAALSSMGVSYYIVSRVEANSATLVNRAVPVKDVGWLSTKVDGMNVTLAGDAPDEQARVRVTQAIARVINVSRLTNNIVAPTATVTAPEVKVEIVQNEKISSIIGLLPRDPSPASLYQAMNRAKPLLTTLNLVEDTTADSGEAWQDNIAFLGKLVGILPNVKISSTPGKVQVEAVAESEERASEMRKQITALAPTTIELKLDISAPRPLITPFKFRLTKNGKDVELRDCSATNIADVRKIRGASAAIENTKIDECTLGLGAPTENWGGLVADILGKLESADIYDLDIKDNQVMLKLSDQIDDEAQSNIVSDIRRSLPPGFGIESEILITKRSIEDLKAEGGEAQLAFARGEDGVLKITGVVPSTTSTENLNGFAVAKFGTENVDINVSVIDDLPNSWEKNAFTALQVIATMPNGQIVLTPDRVAVEGTAENNQVRDGLIKVLNEEMSDVKISTDIEAVAEITTASGETIEPSVCVERINDLLLENPIQFEKSSTLVAVTSLPNLERVAAILLDCRSYAFEIGGHTDSGGGEALNLRLSQERADSVLTAILGISGDFGQLSAKGFGPAEPIASNDTEEGRAKNRRIEIRLIGEVGG